MHYSATEEPSPLSPAESWPAYESETPFLLNEWTSFDRLTAVFLCAAAMLFAVRAILWQTAPAEDALMLLRYAKHLAAGGGITWNLGDRPIEGATDFLYMAVIAGLVRLLHSGPILTARILLLVSHAATVVLVYCGARRLFAATREVALALAIYLMLGPGLRQATDCFSGPFYGLAAMGAWWFACAMVVRGVTAQRTWSFALLALATGLIRPDGVFLAVFMTLTLVLTLQRSRRGADGLRIAAVVAAVFLLLGGSYFLWRYHYFGYLLPNPYYKKGHEHIYPDSLHRSVFNVFKMLLPIVPAGFLGLLFRSTRKRVFFVFMPAVQFSLIWVLLSNENNSSMRFQYVVIPMTLMCVPYLIGELQRMFPSSFRFGLRPAVSLGSTAVLALVFGWVHWKMVFPFNPAPDGSGAYNIARGLNQWKDRNFTIVVTEAGVIPYFSDWRAIDAWGLNDSVMVHDKRGLTEEYLDANHPAIIMFHLAADMNLNGAFQRIWRGEAPDRQDISQFMLVLGHYAATHNYELAARWGDNYCNVHVWYVRRDLPEASQMVDLIRRSPHFFLDDQVLAYDYRNDPPPTACVDPGFRMTPGS